MQEKQKNRKKFTKKEVAFSTTISTNNNIMPG